MKHHGHPEFEIDIPGKDSYRHRAAGSKATAILSSKRLAFTCDLAQEISCSEALELMPNYDLVLVEGFRGIGLPTIELLRAENPKDQIAAEALIDRLSSIEPSRSDDEAPDRPAMPAAIVTDMPALSKLPAKPLSMYSVSRTLKLLRRFCENDTRVRRLPLPFRQAVNRNEWDNQKH